MTDPTQEFMARVVTATESMPYSVTGTNDGFDLRTDIGDEQWLSHLKEEGLAQAHLHHVAIEGLIYTITSDSRDLCWGAGVPVLATPKDIRKLSRQAKRNPAPDGVAAHTASEAEPFAPEEGRHVITSAGEELGLTHNQSGRRVEIILTATAIIATVVVSFAVAVWVLFLR